MSPTSSNEGLLFSPRVAISKQKKKGLRAVQAKLQVNTKIKPDNINNTETHSPALEFIKVDTGSSELKPPTRNLTQQFVQPNSFESKLPYQLAAPSIKTEKDNFVLKVPRELIKVAQSIDISSIDNSVAVSPR